MVNLKVIQIHLKSVGSIQKITKSMKMVSTAKYGKADKLLKVVRPFGLGARMFYDKVELENKDSEEKDKLIFAITSDRGLCGAVHTQVTKRILKELYSTPSASKDMKVVCVGEKSRYIMQYSFPNNIILSVSDIGRVPPTFIDASKIIEKTKGVEFKEGRIIFNKFNSIVSYTTTEIPLYNYATVTASPKLDMYSYEHDDLYSFIEFSQASLIYYTLVENSCSEQSARMTAMENASKNASEMIDKLKLEYNQSRQSIITQELIEIISGAAALK